MALLYPLRPRRRLAGLLLSLLLTLPTAAQTLDRTFQPVDVRVSYPTYEVIGYSLEPDTQGRVIFGGRFDFLAGQPAGNLTRLLPDGTRDATFNPGGAGANGQVLHVIGLPGGRWLIAGGFTRYNGRPAPSVARLHPDGALDTTFNAATGPDGYAKYLAVDSQERLVMSGYFRRTPGARRTTGLVRLLPNGAFDPTFQPANTLGTDSIINAMAVDAADRVLVSHHGPLVNGGPTLERLLPSGALDPAFYAGQAGVSGGVMRQIKVLANGKLLVVHYGGWPTYNGTPIADLVRLNADGTLDPSFDTDLGTFSLRTITETPTGQLLVAGNNLELVNTTMLGTSLVRLQADGTRDLTFVGPFLADQYHRGGVNDVAIGVGGKLLVAGQFQQLWSHTTVGVGRLLATGAVDTAFSNADLDAHGSVFGLVRQSGDRLLTTGFFRSINGQAASGVGRLLADGAFDPSFHPDSALWFATLNRKPLLVDAADRIVGLSINDGRPRRFLPNGQSDPGFRLGSGPGSAGGSGLVAAAALYADGRILAAGSFDTYDGHARPGLVRLLADGTVDLSFHAPDSLFGHIAEKLTLLPDGSIAVKAYPYSSFPGGIPSGVALFYWLDATGHPLPTVNGGQSVPDTVVSNLLAALPDTTLLVRGVFARNGVPTYGVYKLTRAGTVDPGFVLDPALDAPEFRVVPQPDGQLLLLGEFPGNPTTTLQRITPSGAADPTFRLPDIDPIWVGAVAFQSTGKLVVGGFFNTVDGAPYPTLARLTNLVTGLPAPPAAGASALQLYPNPARATLTLRRPTAEPATATLLDILGRSVRTWSLTTAEQRLPLTGLPAGAYVVRVASTSGVVTRRLVVE